MAGNREWKGSHDPAVAGRINTNQERECARFTDGQVFRVWDDTLIECLFVDSAWGRGRRSGWLLRAGEVLDSRRNRAGGEESRRNQVLTTDEGLETIDCRMDLGKPRMHTNGHESGRYGGISWDMWNGVANPTTSSFLQKGHSVAFPTPPRDCRPGGDVRFAKRGRELWYGGFRAERSGTAQCVFL